MKRSNAFDILADEHPSKLRILDPVAVAELEGPPVLSYSYSQPNGAEVSMGRASMVSTLAAGQSVASHSLVSQDFTHQAIDQALRAELDGKMIRGILIKDFVQAAFPKAYRGIQQSPLYDRRQGYFDAVDKYLKIAETATHRSQTYESFIFIVNHVVMTRYAPMKMMSMEGRPVKGGPNRRVPACILCNQRVNSPDDVTWEDVLVPFYFTATRGEPSASKGVGTPSTKSGRLKGGSRAAAIKATPAPIKLEPHEVLAGYALEILSASGLRQHTITVLVDNKLVSLWYFDRSGVISSTEMDLETAVGRDMLYTVLGVFSLANRDDMGYVRRIFPGTEWPFPENVGGLHLRDRKGTPKSWELANLTKLNTGSRGLIGRGTTVYSFGDDEKDFDAPFALKLSWQPISRLPEAKFFEAAENAGVEGIPRFLAGDELANLSEGIRGRLQCSLNIGAEQSDRELRALVFDRVCRPLNEFPIMERPLDFLRIFKQLIITHYDLCSRARMLHRDVSPNNLMWAPGGSGGMRVRQSRDAKQQTRPSEDIGYLVDLDFAAIVENEVGTVEQIGIDDLPHTLALPFLAIDHLPPDILMVPQSSPPPTTAGRHIYRHDLESFFWSVWWILLKMVRDRDGSSSIDEILAGWQSHNLGKNRASKRGFLLYYAEWSVVVSQSLWPQHERVTMMESFLNNMSTIFINGYIALEEGSDYPTAGGHITFKNLLQVFPQE